MHDSLFKDDMWYFEFPKVKQLKINFILKFG